MLWGLQLRQREEWEVDGVSARKWGGWEVDGVSARKWGGWEVHGVGAGAGREGWMLMMVVQQQEQCQEQLLMSDAASGPTQRLCPVRRIWVGGGGPYAYIWSIEESPP